RLGCLFGSRALVLDGSAKTKQDGGTGENLPANCGHELGKPEPLRPVVGAPSKEPAAVSSGNGRLHPRSRMGGLMPADRDGLTVALAQAIGRNGSARGPLAAIRREPTPYVTSFPCEIVTCRFEDGARLRLFCKYAAKDGKCSHGQRGGVGYEARVYRRILKPDRLSTPAF